MFRALEVTPLFINRAGNIGVGKKREAENLLVGLKLDIILVNPVAVISELSKVLPKV